MSHREEALVSVLNAARALRADRQLPSTLSVHLAHLYGAIDAYDAVDGEPAPPMRPPGLCAEPACWRYAIVPGGTCFQCSEWATAERVRVVEGDDG